MTSIRIVRLAARAALAAAVAMAMAAAAADPPGAPPPQPAPRARPAPRPDAAKPAPPRAKWTAPKPEVVSPGVLVRAASRKPLERACPGDAAAGAPSAQGTHGGASRNDRCPPEERAADRIEIDWHADPASP